MVHNNLVNMDYNMDYSMVDNNMVGNMDYNNLIGPSIFFLVELVA